MPRIDNDIKLDFKDVLLRPKRSTLKSRSEVDLERTIIFKNSKQTWKGIPIIAANMDTVGTFEMAKTLAKIKFICLDVANGYSEVFVEYVRKVRKHYPHHTILAGNVVTGEMVEELILSGADIIKVGIGPGSVCTTRKKAGVGYPQLSAVIECADAAHGLAGHIISDGGCTCPGDIAKAFGAGADFVMMGGMLAGHDQSGGEIIERNGKKMKQFYGMSSATAMQKYSGGVAEYRASEGKSVEIPYKGDVNVTILDILGGLRSACTYTGAGKLKELPKRTTFIRVTQQTNEIFAGLQSEKQS
ncbi:GMP reductase 2 isoform X2 [Cherax quadricarinatus]|uniref:GMP reductase 2 isoform X2 n=1 Tax=Cherax quadricarinatus TaxID=27406 RepID=UPI00387EBE82